jgi:tungstate transport system ATP-binding protein
LRPQVETAGIEKAFGGRTVLRGIDLAVDAGEMFVIIGPTGAGKTTLLHILGLLDEPTAGWLRLLGADCGTGSAVNHLKLRRRMAFVQQKPIAFNMSLWDNIAQPLRWRGFERAVIEARVDAMLEATGMHACARRNALTLSGGEIQRLAIARALVSRPELLLLDEPTANLDPESVLRIEELLQGIVRQRETTVVMTTHDLAQAGRLADRVGVLVDGEMKRTGTPVELREMVERAGVHAASLLFA